MNVLRQTQIEILRLITDKFKNKFSKQSQVITELLQKDSSQIHESIFYLNSMIEQCILNKIECDQMNEPNNQVNDQCDSILDWCWQTMNCGQWNNVSQSIRQIYAYHRLLKAILILDNKTKLNNLDCLIEALESIDHGLIMSPDLDGKLLSTVSTLIHHNIITLLDNMDNNKLQVNNNEYYNKWNKLRNIDLTSFTTSKSIKIPILNISHDCSIQRVHKMELFDFECNHLRSKVPIIITGATKDWPCFCKQRRWCIEYLLRTASFRMVPVEIGSKYTEETWSQKLMKLIDFIDQYIFTNNQNPNEIGYMAQHNLFEQIPELENDFLIPDLCASTELDNIDDNSLNVDINGWFGPPGTVSPLHTDPKHNLFVQVIGRKYIRLYSHKTPHEQIYPYEENLLSNTSAVDLEDVDTDKFNLFNQIDPSLIYECILEEGEMLYIPKQWWHFVKSLNVSFSLSFWW